MLYYKNNEWHLANEKVRCLRQGVETEHWVGIEGREWWLDFEQKWDDMEIVEFISIISNERQILRLAEINELSIPDGFSEILSDYVKEGKFPSEASHILSGLEAKKENAALKEDLNDAVMELSMLIAMGGA